MNNGTLEKHAMSNGTEGGVVHLLRLTRTQCHASVAFVALRNESGEVEITAVPSADDGAEWTLETLQGIVRQTLEDPLIGEGRAVIRVSEVFRRYWPGERQYTRMAVAPLNSVTEPERPWGLLCALDPISGQFSEAQLDMLGRLAIRLMNHLRARKKVMEDLLVPEAPAAAPGEGAESKEGAEAARAGETEKAAGFESGAEPGVVASAIGELYAAMPTAGEEESERGEQTPAVESEAVIGSAWGVGDVPEAETEAGGEAWVASELEVELEVFPPVEAVETEPAATEPTEAERSAGFGYEAVETETGGLGLEPIAEVEPAPAEGVSTEWTSADWSGAETEPAIAGEAAVIEEWTAEQETPKTVATESAATEPAATETEEVVVETVTEATHVGYVEPQAAYEQGFSTESVFAPAPAPEETAFEAAQAETAMVTEEEEAITVAESEYATVPSGEPEAASSNESEEPVQAPVETVAPAQLRLSEFVERIDEAIEQFAAASRPGAVLLVELPTEDEIDGATAAEVGDAGAKLLEVSRHDDLVLRIGSGVLAVIMQLRPGQTNVSPIKERLVAAASSGAATHGRQLAIRSSLVQIAPDQRRSGEDVVFAAVRQLGAA